MIEPLPLASSKKEWFYLFFIISIIFTFNLVVEYSKFNLIKSEEIYIVNAQVKNIYFKKNYNILKLETPNFNFFTSSNKNLNIQKLDNINITIVTKKIRFIDYLKSFYAPSFNVTILNKPITNFDKYSKYIASQHQNQQLSELFNALFLAIPTNKNIKKLCAKYGISHLIAISGFHLGVISFILYWLFYIIYKPIKQKYFPYRNTKFDILVIVSIFLFSYLIFLGLVPSLLRAFLMFIVGIYFLRSNIKVISFQTLLIVTTLIIAIFPKLLFSLSLWFSVAGVFYIFLFLQYFKNLPKIAQFLLFNVWIYLAMNPITHFFFGTTSLEQLYSPIFTIGFSIFYPIELFLHLINYGDLLDKYLDILFNKSISSKDIFTPLWVFISYIIISLFSIPCPKWFRTLNIAFIAFNLWLYLPLIHSN